MLKTYTLEKREKWDEIVKSFSQYDVYYLSGYVRAFEINGDGQAMLIYYENEEKSTRAINVIMKRDIGTFEPLKQYIGRGELFDIVTPYGYGGFIVEGTDTQSLKDEYENFCKENYIVCEFVRFHPMLSNWQSVENIYDVIHLGHTVYMDTSSEEIIWQNLSSKNRNMIRKAQKEGLEVFWSRDSKIIEPFMEIYNATMDKDQASEYYYFDKDFYNSILHDLKHNAMWFYAVKDGEIAAISIFMFCNGQMHYHLSASRREYSKLAPTNLLLYEAAVWAFKNGYKSLHMGGGVGSGQDSLYKFKKAFNRGDDVEFCIGKKIFDEETYQKLMDFRMKENEFEKDSHYFPIYRA